MMRHLHWRYGRGLVLILCAAAAACSSTGGGNLAPSSRTPQGTISADLTPPSTIALGPTATSTAKVPPPSARDCPIFPADNVWNRDISALPVDPHSSEYIASIGGQGFLHPDFGSNLSYGIPYNIVQTSVPGVPVSFLYADESDPGPYPIP